MNKSGFTIFGLILAVLLGVIIGSLNGKKQLSAQETNQTNQASQTNQMNRASQNDPMHGPGVSIDETLFNNLLGKTAPDFTLESYDGKEVTLSKLRGKNVILFFNEGLMCYPACWNQIAAFGNDTSLQAKAVILNISVDTRTDWKQAVDKMPELSKATVLLDTGLEVSKKYGVLTLPSSMHTGQLPGHSYVLINKDGIVKFVQDDVQMAVRNLELSSELDKF